MKANFLKNAILFALLIPLTCLGRPLTVPATETRVFALDHDRHLVVSLQVQDSEAPWLVYVPGSGDGLNKISQMPELRFLARNHPYNILVINKVGVELNGKVASKDAFQHGSIRSQRIQDNLTVMAQLVPNDAPVLLVALSEGAYIAPEIAQADPRVKALVLLSGNSWSWLEEEVMYLPSKKRHALREFLEKEVIPHPVFDKFYGDGNFWSYAYFDSYNTDMTYRTLLNLDLPILALNGEKDDVLWLKGAVENMRKLIDVEHKTNIEFHMIPGASHLLTCPDKAKNCDQAAMYATIRKLLRSFSDRTL